MSRNEKTSKKVARKAGKALRTGKASKKDLRSIAGSDLTQAPSRKGGKKKK